jgi:hypothetical protein
MQIPRVLLSTADKDAAARNDKFFYFATQVIVRVNDHRRTTNDEYAVPHPSLGDYSNLDRRFRNLPAILRS